MDRFRQKTKKEKPMKHVDKEKTSTFTDVKTIKENLKIKEILRSVKMNSSMRIKAPRGSVVMNDNDFIDTQEYVLDEKRNVQDATSQELQEAKNLDLVNNLIQGKEKSDTALQGVVNVEENQFITQSENLEYTIDSESATKITELTSNHVEDTVPNPKVNEEILQCQETAPIAELSQTKISNERPVIVKNRERKLSLDNTMLTRRESLSQSEVDLHSIGKSPLERKSSFFRKKMDSFLKNTTEIFKRQSLGSKSQSISRRGSMSVSLQSLNEKVAMDEDDYGRTARSQLEVRGSGASIASASTQGASEPGSTGASSQPVLSSSQPSVLHSSQPSVLHCQGSPNGSNGANNQDSLLNSRAISMSSGLDSAFGQRRRKTSRSNRVTWVASEGLTNYLRRLTQDETNREMYAAHSYQDFSSIPENSLHEPRLDSKGRRLSYQRAVSGEDPAPPPRHDSSLRRKPLIPENSEEVRGSGASIASASTQGASEPGSTGASSQPVLSSSQPSVLHSSQPSVLHCQGSPNGSNGANNQDSLLNSRAISMSSGLDSAFGQRRRKTSRSNRVTWVASEGLTNYLRRLTQDETNREMYAAHSYQDFSSIPENSLHEPRLDSKGRRLSYQRAVSGEDPAPPPRHDSSLRRKPLIPENSEVCL